MQRAALLSAVAVAVGVLRLGEGSPLPPVAAAATVSPPHPARTEPPAAPAPALSRLLPAASSSSSSAAEVSSMLQKREASPSLALMVRRLTRAHSQQKREASPVPGHSLSINNPIRVLRNRVALQMYRKLIAQRENMVQKNHAFLTNKGKRKRSVRGSQLKDHRQISDDRFLENLSQWLLS